ncbi:PaaX family transcriptional regulator [Streptomyces sp. NBC_00582]|uniref:PaaX family transcriptional regulator n=1 Tax=Streptomyces sp. NBC_00582 TaxID=2975783 RepID=UPI002E803E86|nr:PaaX family transcriptional regulator C-terminal domain-containing protein [Streptomyces sp. NBC_00582]WUB59616.1 PaaX family transcriptional regulator [Streptomyces sp. NBC_00582]
MTVTKGDRPAAATRRSRTVLVSFLGAIVRKMGNWMPIAGAVELLSEAGLDAPSVRTAVFRLKKRGWLVSESRSGMRGYALTPAALEALATGDEVIWHARQPADLGDGWCFVNFSVPESARALRHQLTAHLTSLGFGNIGSAVWIAPARMLPAAQRAIAELELTEQCAVFVGDYVAGQPLPSMVRGGWDLDGIDQRYREFIGEYEGEADRLAEAGVIAGTHAFVTYLSVIDHWRKLPFRDPGLPREVLAEDWSGPAAVRLFERMVTTLEGRALAHAASYWSAQPRTADRTDGRADGAEPLQRTS